MRVKRQHKRLSFMLLALTAASLLSTSDLSSSLLYRQELSLIDDRNINIEDKDVLVVLDIQQTGMESFVDNVIRNVKVDTPCQCKQEMTKCKCLNSQGNHWFFNTYNTTGYVCGDHADFTTLTNCPIDYWFRSTGGDTRPYRRYLIMTMLRDPVERYLSEWMFTRNEDTRFKNEPRLFRSDSTELQKKGLECYVGKKLADLTIEEFMDCKENQAQNRQTRMLANLSYVSSLRLTGDDYDKALLESAKNTLQTIPFFALFDRPNDNLKLFERTFKLQISPPPTLSKDESMESLLVSAAVKHKIIQLNSLDLKLYVLAKEIYQGRVNEMRSTSSKKDEVDNFQIVYRPDLEDKDSEEDDEDDGDNDVVVEYDDSDENNEDEVKKQISSDAKKDGGGQSSLKSGEELLSSLSSDKEMSDDDNDDDDGTNDEKVFIDDVEKRHDRIKEVYENDEGMMGEEEEEGQEDKGEKVEFVEEEEKNEEEEALNNKGKREETDADEDITDEDNDGKIDEGNKSIEKSQSGISEDANLKDNIQKSLPDYPMDEEDVSMFFNRLAQSRQQQQQQKQQFQQLLLQQQQQKQNPPPNQPLQNQQLQKQQQNLVARAKPLASSLSSSKTSKEQAQLLQKSQPLQQKAPAQPRTQASADSSLSSKLNSGDIKAKLIQQLQSINKPSVPSSDKSASINNVGGISHGGGIKPLLNSKSEVKREAVAPLKGRSQEEKDLHRMFL